MDKFDKNSFLEQVNGEHLTHEPQAWKLNYCILNADNFQF